MKSKILGCMLCGFFLLVWMVLLSSTTQAAIDLSEIGVGARVLSLGRTYAGGVDDASSIFTNPAGLADGMGFKAISMSGTLLTDVNYLLLGAANDSPLGKVGIGFVSAAVPSIPLISLEGSGSSATIVQTGTTDYASSMILLSYANKLSKLLKGKGDNLSFGVNLKYFLQGFSGDVTALQNASMQNATGLGLDADLGIILDVNDWMRLGVTAQNFLPENLGGKFTWQKNNVTESIPLNLRAGGLFNLVGKTAFYKHAVQRLNFMLDYEAPLEGNRPACWHTGVEYLPLKIIALRLGMDQAPRGGESGVGVDTNSCAGVGIDLQGFTFDYAYHQFGDLGENATHFFSIGFKEFDEVIKKKLEKEDKKGRLPAPQVVPKPQLKSFVDVPAGYWAENPIEYIATLGIMNGYPDGTFAPESDLTRGELAVVLVKAKQFETHTVGKTGFSDIQAQDWLAPFVDVVVQHNYMQGYSDGTFRPEKKVTRAEAAAIFSKFSGLYEKDKVTDKVFPDVRIEHWASPALAATKGAGFFEYLSDKEFKTSNYLTRAEACEILSKTPTVKERIKKLLAGEK